jgi:hypothetical protein
MYNLKLTSLGPGPLAFLACEGFHRRLFESDPSANSSDILYHLHAKSDYSTDYPPSGIAIRCEMSKSHRKLQNEAEGKEAEG